MLPGRDPDAPPSLSERLVARILSDLIARTADSFELKDFDAMEGDLLRLSDEIIAHYFIQGPNSRSPGPAGS